MKMRLMLSIVVILFCELFFFRNVITSDLLIGGAGDGRLTMLLAEHWHQVLVGNSNIMDLGIFYPSQNTLAYSDMFFTFGVIHSCFRLIGLDMFSAFKVALIVVHLFGGFALYYLLRKTCQLDDYWSLFATISFNVSSTYALHICHTQLVTFSLLPLVAIFVIDVFKYFHQRIKRDIYAFLSVICYGLILYNSWYTAFFIIIFTGVTLCFVGAYYCWFVYKKKQQQFSFLVIKKWFQNNVVDLVFLVLTLILVLAPFAIAELSVLQMSGGYKYKENLRHTPEVIDIINVSEQNLMLGRVLHRIYLRERNLSFEVQTGFSLVLLSVFVFLGCSAVKQKNNKFDLMLPLILSICFNIILCLQLSSNGVSFWYLIYKLIPGGKSIRAVGRYLFFLSFPMSLMVATLASKTNFLKKHKVTKVLLLGMLFVSNVRLGGANADWKKQDVIDTDLLPAPPEKCQVFYLEKPIQPDKPAYYYHLDAYQINNHFSLPTINGYSGLTPENYGHVWDIDENSYPTGIYEWITSHDLKNVCTYDQANNTWSDFDVKKYLSKKVDASAEAIEGIAGGIWDWRPSGEYSWTKPEVDIVLRDEDISQYGLDITLASVPQKYQLQTPGIQPKIELYINGQYAKDLPVVDEKNIYHFDVETSPDDIYRIKIKTNFYFNPQEIGESQDDRDLSLQLYYVGAPRSLKDGKKIGWKDGVRAIWCIWKYRYPRCR